MDVKIGGGESIRGDIARTEQGNPEGSGLKLACENVPGARQCDGLDFGERHIEIDRSGGQQADTHVFSFYSDLQGSALDGGVEIGDQVVFCFDAQRFGGALSNVNITYAGQGDTGEAAYITCY